MPASRQENISEKCVLPHFSEMNEGNGGLKGGAKGAGRRCGKKGEKRRQGVKRSPEWGERGDFISGNCVLPHFSEIREQGRGTKKRLGMGAEPLRNELVCSRSSKGLYTVFTHRKAHRLQIFWRNYHHHIPLSIPLQWCLK